MYGMTWEEFWFESMERYAVYWQKHQYEIEKRNNELWMQGIYIGEAINAAFDSKHQCKYPEKPHRITEMTDVEKEIEAKRKVKELRERLMEIKRRSDARQKGGG